MCILFYCFLIIRNIKHTERKNVFYGGVWQCAMRLCNVTGNCSQSCPISDESQSAYKSLCVINNFTWNYLFHQTFQNIFVKLVNALNNYQFEKWNRFWEMCSSHFVHLLLDPVDGGNAGLEYSNWRSKGIKNSSVEKWS